MKVMNGSLLNFILILGLSVSVPAFSDEQLPMAPKFSNRVENILARVQADATARIKANRPLPRPEKNPLTTLFGELPKEQEAALRRRDELRKREVRVHTPTADERANDVLAQQHTNGPLTQQEIPSFVMRADGQPLSSNPFKRSFSIGGNSKQIQELRGCLRIDHDEEDVPQFKVYFEGMETTNNSEGFFSFPVDGGSLDMYSIIICNKIKHSFGRRNTVDSFGLIPDMNYKYYRFNRNYDGSGKWMQHTNDLGKKNLLIPSNAIVITINPAYFDRIEETWPGDFGSGILKLPRIVFKEGRRAKLERKSIKSLLWGLDMSPFHTQVRHTIKEIGNGRGELVVSSEQ